MYMFKGTIHVPYCRFHNCRVLHNHRPRWQSPDASEQARVVCWHNPVNRQGEVIIDMSVTVELRVV